MKHTRLPSLLASLAVLIGLVTGCDNALQPTQSDVTTYQFDPGFTDESALAGDHPTDSIQWNGQPQEDAPSDSVQWDGEPWDCYIPDEPDTAYHDPEPWVPNWPDTI